MEHLDGEQERLGQAVEEAWSAYHNAAKLSVRVSPAAPILFFGDLVAYTHSILRVLTVGLNPSRLEFPADRPFLRFPLCEGSKGLDSNRYLDALSSYFRTCPYRSWFSAFEPLLNGLGTSYYSDATSAALHTDICSPIATDPTWSRLGDDEQSILEADGGPLWHMLVKALRPHLVVLSVAKRHLRRIGFEPMGNSWNVIHTFHHTGRGAPRSRPYKIRARWYDVGGVPSLFVFGPAAQTPFGLVSDIQKSDIGRIVLEVYRDGR